VKKDSPLGSFFYLPFPSQKISKHIDLYREISIFKYMNKINYTKIAKQLKVMADPKRLKIINLLSNGEMCATDILKEFRVSQPTLSHDMKALVDEKFVTANRIGQKMIYSLNPDTIFDLQAALGNICSEDL
jgi:ArsR family transcriptional regulator